ncbi:plantaricin C family lantibiotic [Paenibacillus amylolyticus]
MLNMHKNILRNPLKRNAEFENPAGNIMIELSEAELNKVHGAANSPNTYNSCYSKQKSCGNFCTFTTECPFLSFCC